MAAMAAATVERIAFFGIATTVRPHDRLAIKKAAKSFSLPANGIWHVSK